MILVDDNFANIVDAIAEGRVIYDNMKKFIVFLLSANAGEVLTVLLGLLVSIALFGKAFLPLIAIQLLFINLVTDTFPALALGMDTPEGDVMNRPPRSPKEPLLDRNLFSTIVLIGPLSAVLALFCYYYAIDFGNSMNLAIIEEIPAKASTMAFTALVVYQLIHSINSSERYTIFSKITFKNRALIAAFLFGLLLQVSAVYVPLFQDVLHTVDLNSTDWLVIFLSAIPIVIVEEIRKKIFLPAKND
jgi:Ca2+-transporting ATPase